MTKSTQLSFHLLTMLLMGLMVNNVPAQGLPNEPLKRSFDDTVVIFQFNPAQDNNIPSQDEQRSANNKDRVKVKFRDKR